MSSEPANDADLVLDEAPASGKAPLAAAGVPSGEVILEGRGIVKTYDMGDRGLQVLRGVSIDVRRGEILAIQGPSGAGKSTLLHVLGLLDEPDEGLVLWKGENVLSHGPAERARYRNEKIGFVFQFYHLFPDLSALENVCLPIMVRLGTFEYRAQREIIREKAAALLKLVGLEERATHLPNELSGGERQRVAIARALMNDPEVVLCDEPTGNLDQKTAGEILDLLWRLNRETGKSFVIVTHDMGLARRAHRSVSVIDGIVAPAGTAVKPRGFAETRFRLRNPGAFFGFRPSPVLVGAVMSLFAPLQVFWLGHVHEKFYRTTRRGHGGTFAIFGFLLPLYGQVYLPFADNYGPLRAAHRLLRANGEAAPHVVVPLLASFLYGASLIAVVVLGAFAASSANPVERDGWLMGLASAQIVFGLSAAWIQAQMNDFYDRMAPKKDE